MKRKSPRELPDFKDHLLEMLKDPEAAKHYLETAWEDYQEEQDEEALLLVLRDVIDAQGGMTKMSKKTKLNRQNLYRALSGKGNPRLSTLTAILNALGMRLALKPMNSTAS